VVTNACNPNTREAKAGESRVPGQSGLQSETLSQKTKKQNKNFLRKQKEKQKPTILRIG
jgi:hypothetical protein